MISMGLCLVCNRERNLRFNKRTTCSSCYSKEWSQKNRERRRELDRKSYSDNKELRKFRVRSWQESNQEKVNFYKEVWRKNNPGYSAFDRAVRKRAIPSWLTEEQMKLIEDFYLNRPVDHHVDHIVPLKGKDVCGLHVPWNLQYLPARENLRKGNKLWRS